MKIRDSRELDEKTIVDNFKHAWNNNSLSDDDPIMKMVKSLSKAAGRFGWESFIKDIQQNVLLKISRCDYTGEGSLEGYVRKSVINEINTLFHREHQDRRGEMPDERAVEAEFDRKLEEEEESNGQAKMILSRTPEHLKWYVEAVLGAESFVSERKLANKCGVTKYRVETAKKELEKIFDDMKPKKPLKLAKDAETKHNTVKFNNQ